jgi:5'-methylthioadenosine phosphorylase
MKVGVIGGSGLYGLPNLENVKEEQIVTPFGPPSSNLVTATLNGAEVIFLARHGRDHTIMPSELNHRANVYALKSLGVEAVFSISAVGSLRAEMAPGDVVLVDQFIDRTRSAANATFFGDGIVAHVSMADPTCGNLANLVADAAAAADPAVKIHRGGTYVNMAGPAFSTRAESHLYRSWGMDVIGMTNLAEAKLCREAEICYQTVAMVTDFDCWHETEEAVTVDAILATLRANADFAGKLLTELVPATSAVANCGAECPAQDALKYAIVTHPDSITDAHRQRLAAVIGRYFRTVDLSRALSSSGRNCRRRADPGACPGGNAGHDFLA